MEMKREDTKEGRFYEGPAGRKLPSVTTILSALAKPALIGWAAKEERKAVIGASWTAAEDAVASGVMPNPHEWAELILTLLGPQKAHLKLMKDAAEIGSAVHKWIEWQLRQELRPSKVEPPSLEHPLVLECVEKWKEWRASVDLVPLDVEQRIASQDYGFGGTYDLLAEVNGRRTLIDFKTGKAVYAEAFLQNCAYRLALSEAGVATEQGMIVRLPKDDQDPLFEAVMVPPMEDLIVPFLCLIPVWRWAHKEEQEYRKKRKARQEQT